MPSFCRYTLIWTTLQTVQYPLPTALEAYNLLHLIVRCPLGQNTYLAKPKMLNAPDVETTGNCGLSCRNPSTNQHPSVYAVRMTKSRYHALKVSSKSIIT